MIITRLKGGLGNQLFQYAIGRRIAYVNKVPLKVNASAYTKFSDRQYGLKHFNIAATIASGDEIKRFHALDAETVMRKFLPYYRKKIVYEKEPYFDANILGIRRKNLYIVGHWEAAGYFADIDRLLREDFTLKKPITIKYKELIDKIRATNSVSFHIRRGDHLSEKFQHGNKVSLPKTYFQKSLAVIGALVKKPQIFVSSDDISWVRNNIKIDFPVIYLSWPGLLDYEELILMSYCKHNIIADSSFSWWAAWLNNNPEKVVIAPANWRVDPVVNKKYVESILPGMWIRIPS